MGATSVRRTAVVVVALAASCGGSGETGDAGPRPSGARSPYVIEIDPGATAAASAASVQLDSLVRTAADPAFERLPQRGQVRIEITAEGPTIPELGVGGFTDPGTGDITISIGDAPDEASRVELFEVWLPVTLTHEAHHSSRIRTGPGYGRTLGEALVTEGLADHFVRELLTDAPTPPWVEALTPRQLRDTWVSAGPELWMPNYDHPAWFLGTGDIPRWSGYSLGFDSVRQFLDVDSRRPSELVDVLATDVLEQYAPPVE